MFSKFNSKNKYNNNQQSDIDKKISNRLKNENSNPIESSIVNKINNLNLSANANNRLYGGYYNASNKVAKKVDLNEFVSIINEIFSTKDDVSEVFYSIHNLCSNCLNTNYTALGLLNLQKNCINLKLIDKLDSVYSNRLLTTNDINPVVKAYLTREVIVCDDSSFLSVVHLKQDHCFILPIVVKNETKGVILFGSQNKNVPLEELKLISTMMGLFVQNRKLEQKVIQNTDNDALTGLYNYRKIQQICKLELNQAKNENYPLSIIMLDINNMMSINKEFGCQKGDEIIQTVAKKIKELINLDNYYASRYVSDDFCIIMPNVNELQANEFGGRIKYSLSCQNVDDVGPIKVSIGVTTINQNDESFDVEKVFSLAKQAMYISKSKSYETGESAIITSSQFKFWDENALKSYASVMTKQYSHMGANFEEELINQIKNEDVLSQVHLIDLVTLLASAIDAKDEYTKGHSVSVSRYSEALARALNLPEKEVEQIKLGALLHDVGKIGIPEHILKKTDKLTDEEWKIMKEHPVIGAEKVLKSNASLHKLIPIVKHHHEHYDGSGYPDKLKGENIPLVARIVAVADAYHALISDRPYRKGLSIEKACEILRIGANIQWDSNLVRKFIELAPSLSTKV